MLLSGRKKLIEKSITTLILPGISSGKSVLANTPWSVSGLFFSRDLALSMIRRHTLVLASLFLRLLASHTLMKTFEPGVAYIFPPRHPSVDLWYLNLVLSALQTPPFDPIRHILGLPYLQGGFSGCYQFS